MYYSINKTVTLPVGDFQIYVNPQQETEARTENLGLYLYLYA